MNYRDVAVAVELEAQAGRWTSVLEGAYYKFDEKITERSTRPWAVASYIFHQGSDRQVRNLAALWLYRHAKQAEPDVNPMLGTIVDQMIKSFEEGGGRNAS